MKAFLVVAGLLILIGGCSKSATVVATNYSGNFVLTSAVDIPLTGKMHIRFSDVNFTGAGDSSLLPFVGSGVFKVSGDSIFFTQTGAVPDIFSPGAILEGSFLVERNNDSLVFSRKTNTGGISPEIIYRLRRE